MADESLTIRGINWRETFPFTHIFRSFRVAIHPSKVVLALVALLMLYVGGRVLDAIWHVSDRAVPGEVSAYEAFQKQPHQAMKFSDYRDMVRKQIEANYAAELLAHNLANNPEDAEKAAHNGGYLSRLKDEILKSRAKAVGEANRIHSESISAAAKLTGDARRDAEKKADETRDHSIRAAYEGAYAEYEQAKQIENQGLFDHYFQYESSQVGSVVRGVREWNWFGEERFSEQGGMERWNADTVSVGRFLADSAASQNPLAAANPLATAPIPQLGGTYGQAGVIQSVFRFFTVGPVWLLTQHPLYFMIFGLYFLMLWAIFGGAISRIAAVHVARDEKMSIRSALKFSVGKFLSFLFAPVIPLLIVVVVGIIVAIGALIGNIPFLGPIIVGALFFLALAAGFVMALVLLGLVGGFNLMYPTIAVEGSDSFDAISRSFSYLYARPWRLAFYTVISIIYGALTYLFVRLFIYLMLVLTHKFVGLGFFAHADSTAPLWSTIWPSPTTAARLSYDIDFLTLGVGQDIGAFLVAFWVYLVIAILGAFAISFYFSANTIIYYLMRREVDATELDDVYLEQVDDEFAEPAPMTASQPAPAAASTTTATPSSTSETVSPAPQAPTTEDAPISESQPPT